MRPALQASISKHAPANEQGELQGSLAGLMSATTIIGPPIMTGTFAYFTAQSSPVYFPGAPFLLGAVFMLTSVIISYYALHDEVIAVPD